MMLKERLLFPLTQIFISMLTLLMCIPFACANIAVPHDATLQTSHTSTPSQQPASHAQNATQQLATPILIAQELQTDNNKKQPLPTAQAQSATNSKEQKTTPPLPQGWVQVESGLPPMYAGINGGTIALNIVHSNDGEIFALAGQKGNDFVTILQGNSTPQKSPKVANNKTKENKNIQKIGAEKALNAPTKKPTETIIASSQLASNLAAAQTELLPFGLADTPMTNELFLSQNTPDPVLLALPKLKLGNYKHLLGIPERP